MPHSSLDLTVDPVTDEAVRRCWARLHAAGVASPHTHPRASNRPHVTLTSAETLGDNVVADAARTLALPVSCELDPPQVFDGRRLTIYLPVAVPQQLREIAEALRRAAGDPRADEPWRPHLTLAHRLPPGRLNDALAALGDYPRGCNLVGLTQWDPTTESVTPLRPGGGRSPSG